MKRNFILFFCLLFFIQVTNAYAQKFQAINAFVKSRNDSLPVLFASVSFNNSLSGVITDENGFFKLNFLRESPPDSLIIYQMSFQTRKIAVNAVRTNDTVVFYLEPKEFQLPTAVIKGFSARQTIIQAMKKLSQNFPAKTYAGVFFYRQYHRENEKYVRLIEAKILNKQLAYGDFIANKRQEKICLIALRRSNIYELNREKHGDHLFDLLYDNPVKYPLGTVLNEKGSEYYDFWFDVENCKNSELAINYKNIQPQDGKYCTGKIILNDSTLKILKIIAEEHLHEPTYNFSFDSRQPYSWKFISSYFEMEMAVTSEIKKISKRYEHQLINSKTRMLDYIVEENFELFADSDFMQQNNCIEKMNGNLYSESYLYNEKEWENVPALNTEVKSDMEKKQTLRQQFEGNGK